MRRRRARDRVIRRWKAGRTIPMSWLLEFNSGGRVLLGDIRIKGRTMQVGCRRKPAHNWTSQINQIKSSWSLLLLWIFHFLALFLERKLIVFLILLLIIYPSSTIFPDY